MTKKTKKTVKSNKKKKTTSAAKKTAAKVVRHAQVSKKAVPAKKPAKKAVPAQKKTAKKAAPIKKASVKKAIKKVVKKASVAPKKKATPVKVSTKKTVVKKTVVKQKKAPAPKKVIKKVATPSKKVEVKRVAPVKTTQHVQPKATIQAEKKPFSISEMSPYRRQDIETLCSGFWKNLDLFAFKNVLVDNSLIDVAYASDDAALIVHILSEEGEWSVDSKTDTWTNGKVVITSLVPELLKQKVSLHNVEPQARITPVVLLMRGSVKNEARLQAYLQERNILLLRFDETVPGNAPVLQSALEDHFVPILSSSLSEQEWQQFLNDPTAHQPNAAHTSGNPTFTKKERNSVAAFLATVGHAGYFPKGSGTLGSVLTLPIAYLLSHTYGVLSIWLVSLLLLFIGVWAVKRFTWNKVDKDPSSVIIDEVVGQLIPFAFVIPDLLHIPLLAIGFLSFRFFDIFKFGLVKYFDKQENAWGVMMDDVIAGLQTAIILLIAQAWWILL